MISLYLVGFYVVKEQRYQGLQKLKKAEVTWVYFHML